MNEPISWPDQWGRTPLHYAAIEGEVETVRSLLDGGANPNAQDRTGFSTLHFAAQARSLEVAQLLIERGARVDLVDQFGNQPLWTAVFNCRGDGAIIKLLRDHGADPLHANKSGRTALGLARLIANYPVARWFADMAD